MFTTADDAEEDEDGEPPLKYNKLIMAGEQFRWLEHTQFNTFIVYVD